MFVKDCRNNSDDVIVDPDVLDDARNIFKLYTQEELLTFIGNNGLRNVKWLHRIKWRNNPDPDKDNNPQFVYDYRCPTNGTPYYIAIIFFRTFYGSTINKWGLKSFHLDDYANTPMREQLSRLFPSLPEE
jgi:hypothetical protein